MRSTLTHVIADTWRSVAVIVAAVVAMLSARISTSNGDAIGAIAVQAPIIAMCWSIGSAAVDRLHRGRGDAEEAAKCSRADIEQPEKEPETAVPLTKAKPVA
ncbi:hypothetical protein M885DRAFT_579490 [Pelagophyceae sp. CCMP2097]|nr:hypothetical protein M885DRAFT_579490 [Pelagophyceae sp. CCMP2097]